MLKVVFLLDCDECGCSLDQACVSSTTQRGKWETELDLLKHDAEEDGWRFMSDYLICPECIQEEIKMADWLQEPEDYNY